MTKPRLLCLMQLPPPVHGASVVNQYVANSRRLASAFDVEILPLMFASSVQDIGRPSLQKLARAARTAVRLGAALVTRRPDAVYLTISPVGGAFYRDCVYIALMKAFGVLRIYHVHGKGIAKHARGRWKPAVYRWALRDAAVIHIAPSLAAETRDVPPKRIRFVANGIPDRAGETRRATVGPLKVLYLSNMMVEKGPLVLVEALARLARAQVPFEATFAGAAGDGECVEEFTTAVRQYGLTDQVRYVGPQYGAAKEALLRDHDVLAFPTFYERETFGLVVVEAMQWSLPVVATPEGAIADIITDGVTGFLVPQRDAVLLADRLERLARDRRLVVQMGQRGRARYLERYTLDHFEASLCAALQELIQDGAGSSGL